MKFGRAGLLGLAVVVLVAVLTNKVNAQSCTPSTCPDEPVLAYFEHANCTGEVTYYPMGRDYGVCYNQSIPFLTAEQRPNELAIFQSTDCDLEAPDVSYFAYIYTFGVCGNAPLPFGKKRYSEALGDSSSLASSIFGGRLSERDTLEGPYIGRVFLRNVNASFATPQPFFEHNPSIPALNDESEDCYGPNNCTLASGMEAPFFETYSDGGNCSLPADSSMWPYIENNVCYNANNNSYVKYGCYTGNVRVTSLYYDSSCSTPAAHTLEHFACGTEISFSTTCTADISPMSPLSSPSNANTLVVSLASIMFAALLAILL